MERLETRLEGPILVRPVVHGDERGFFHESYRRDAYAELGIAEEFVQDNHSRSGRGIVRGMHFQVGEGQAKLVRCPVGAVVDVVVDVRRGSPTFGQWEAFELSERNLHQLYCPIGFAHGFCVTSDSADVLYKCSSYYAPDLERGIAYDDPDLAIEWPDVELVPSARDAAAPRLRELEAELPFVYRGAELAPPGTALNARRGPRPPPRASDADRERVVGELLRHTAEGRLEPDELADRTEAAYAASTVADLLGLTADLPALAGRTGPAPALPPARRTLALLGGSSRLGRWRVAREGIAVAVLGSARLDLRRAEFDAAEVAITALAYWGRVEIVVPDGAEVEMTGVGVVASRDVSVRAGPAPAGFPRVRVRAYAAVGSVKVRSRSMLGVGERLRRRLTSR